eukprot:1143211-Pelagomonas_calceolata.AAC.1
MGVFSPPKATDHRLVERRPMETAIVTPDCQPATRFCMLMASRWPSTCCAFCADLPHTFSCASRAESWVHSCASSRQVLGQPCLLQQDLCTTQPNSHCLGRREGTFVPGGC